jgi:hypothetical protein
VLYAGLFQDDFLCDQSPSCQGNNRCAKCLKENYCSRSHQKMDWSRHKPLCGSSSSIPVTSPSWSSHLFPSYSLVIETENTKDEAPTIQSLPQEGLTIIFPSNSSTSSESAGGELDGTLQINNQSSLSDPIYVKFLTRVAVGGTDQVLRYYCREEGDSQSLKEEGDGDEDDEEEEETGSANRKEINSSHLSSLPLPVSSSGYPPLDSIPNCEVCGGKRTFEFQVSLN